MAWTPDAVGGAAILFADDDVLGDVHQLAGHVAGIGGLEGGVGEALAGAVGRDEVFEDGEALAEVGRMGFSMMSPEEGLAMRPRTPANWRTCWRLPRAGINHEGDGVVLEFAVVGLKGAEHDVGDLVGAMGPDINDLVVAFAGRNDAFAVLFFEPRESAFGRTRFPVLFLSG